MGIAMDTSITKNMRMVRKMDDANKIDIMAIVYKALSGIRKTWKLCTLMIVLCAGVFVGNAYRKYTPMYSSKVTFSVIKNFNGQSSFTYNKTATDKLASSFLTILESDLMVNAICQDLNVPVVPATFHTERIQSTNLFSIYASSANPEDAKKTLDSLLKNYPQISKVALNDATLTVIEEPVLAEYPSNRIDYKKVLAKGVLAGLLLYFVVLAGYVLLWRTFEKESDIPFYLHHKCIGSIGVYKEMEKRKPLLITKDLESSHRLKEAFHKIRLSVENDHHKNNHGIYMLTSTLANEGKSMIAANLALSFAGKGKKVLLVDLDLRNPSQAKTFGISAEKADTTIEQGEALFYKFKQVECDTLDVLCTMTGIDTASEVLSNQVIVDLMESQKAYYDYIFLDTPPIHLMVDAGIAAKYAESAILVVRQDYASIDEAQEAMETLQNANAEVLGCILNQVKGVPFFSSRYGYGYGYGYYNHYGYGYGRTGKK